MGNDNTAHPTYIFKVATHVKKKCRKKVNKRQAGYEPAASDYVSTGSTLLNCACTDHPERGFCKGRYYLFVGDSRSGKTFFCLTCLAEASINPSFNEHRFIYDNVERGAMMNIRRFFGSGVAERMRAPAYTRKGVPRHSVYLEEFYYNLDATCDRGQPFIYILDSIDGLTSESEEKKFAEKRKAFTTGRVTPGSYGDGKAAINSQKLRRFISRLEELESILIIVNQTRQLLGTPGKGRSGGNALRFYACMEIWSSVKKLIERTYKGKSRTQGTVCTLRTKKNRVSGKDRKIIVPIYNSYGIDDIGSCIDYLVDERHWTVTGRNVIVAPELDLSGSREKLVQHVTEGELEKDIRAIVGDVWEDIENAIAIKRKPRYV